MIRLLNDTPHDFLGYANLIKQLASNFIEYDYQTYINFLKEMPHIYIYENEGRIVGTIKILIERKFYSKNSYVAHIEDLVVSQEFRGSGIGKTLVDFVIDQCRNQFNCYKVVLYCQHKNQKFYEKSGFKDDGANMCLRF